MADIEENNEKFKISTFYKFQSEKMLMSNANFNERMCPANSFTVACRFHLHINSSSHYEKTRKKLAFCLDSKKKKSAWCEQIATISVDSIFSSEKSSPHFNVLKKLSEMLIFETNSFFVLVALHTDKINLFSRHLFRRKICIFGLSHNECNSLADSISFLMLTLTGKNYQ